MRAITFSILLCLSFNLYAQYPDFQYESKYIADKARELTDVYDAELGLDGEQLPLFYDIVKDHLGTAVKIKKEFQGDKQTYKLKKLKTHEVAKMSEVLTRIQHNYYIRIRPKIQPGYYLADEEY